MEKKLVINVTEPEMRVALLENSTIVELFIQRKDSFDASGNVYKGKVKRVLPGMQAAFIDIGLPQAAFIHVDDVNLDSFREIEDLLSHTDPAEALATSAHSPAGLSEIQKFKPPIEMLLTEGQDIMVHVIKSPIGTKGARVTSNVTLPGRFLVLMPHSDHIGISKRIVDEDERLRLKHAVASLRRDQVGYIVRTASEGIAEDKLASEMNFLTNLWQSIQKKYKNAPSPSLLHQELDISLRAVRDLLTHEADSLIVDSKITYDAILSFLDTFMPSLKNSVALYQGNYPIFDAYNLEGDITRSIKRKVWLKSGGYIVFDYTEALVAIDVNTGRYVGKHNLEETILKTNLEAIKEIAYQIRLRDIGGIIIIDFIDMGKKSNQEKVFQALIEVLKKDRSKTHVLPLSELGLVQMTRKRTREPLHSTLCESCFYCDGEGYLISKQTICCHIYREIRYESHDARTAKIALTVNPEIAELLHGEENHMIVSLERDIGKQIVIYPDEKLHMEAFQIGEIHSQ